MIYELWNMRTRNLMGTYAAEQEALRAVAALIQQHGHHYAERLALGLEDDEGRSRILASGSTLAARALGSLITQ